MHGSSIVFVDGCEDSVKVIYVGVLAASKRSLRTQSPLLQSQPSRVFESTTQMFSTPNFM